VQARLMRCDALGDQVNIIQIAQSVTPATITQNNLTKSLMMFYVQY